MEENELGTYVRDRRVELGLSQEALAERIGGTASQAEISRLERGHVMLPRKARMEDLAAALNVSLGDLLVRSGWLTSSEGDELDEGPVAEQSTGERDREALLGELVEVQQDLLRLIERVASIELALRQSRTP